jgi:hypothetical protein
MTLTPVRSSPAIIARSIGAAPRQRGRSEGCTFSIGTSERSGSLISWPKAQTAAFGPAAAIRSRTSGALTSAACSSSMPSSAAASAAGGGAGRRPRPRRLSGGAMTSEGRWAEDARIRRTVAAKLDVPR